MAPQQILLHLSLCDNFGPVFAQRLLATLAEPEDLSAGAPLGAKEEALRRRQGFSDLNEMYTWTVSDWIHRAQLSETKAAELVTHLRSRAMLEDELATITKAGADYVTLLDDDYPEALRAIHAPPVVLYYRGSLHSLNNAQTLAIIGSRAANSYGARIIKDFVPDLVDAGFTIVSGGALGADSMAHKETLVAGGKTVAVLGSGLCNLYPRTNLKLFEDMIATGGAVVTSFPMRMEPLPQHFPARNRIIAGLSRGCVVVQAAEKSGTRITAQYALQQGREVFVVPGNFDDSLSAGCHALAREGAALVTSAAHICAELGIAVAASEVQQKIIPEESKISKIAQSTEDISPSGRIKAALRVPLSVDELAAQLGLDHDLVQQQLWDLQWQGAVQQDFTGRWQR